MKPMPFILTGIITIVLAGCDSREPQVGENLAEGPTSETNLETTTKDVTEEIEEAMDSTVDLAKETKSDFVSTMKIKMNDLEREMEELSKKAETLEGDAKAQTQQAIARIKEKMESLDVKYENFQASTGDAWKEMKSGFSQAYYELEQSVKDAKEKYMESK